MTYAPHVYVQCHIQYTPHLELGATKLMLAPSSAWAHIVCESLANLQFAQLALVNDCGRGGAGPPPTSRNGVDYIVRRALQRGVDAEGAAASPAHCRAPHVVVKCGPCGTRDHDIVSPCAQAFRHLYRSPARVALPLEVWLMYLLTATSTNAE